MNVQKLPSGKYKAEVRHRGFYRSQTFERKKLAEDWWARTEAEYLAGKRGQPLHKTLGQAFAKYAQEVSPKKKGARWEQIRLAKLGRDEFLSNTLMNDLTTTVLAKWRDRRLTEVGPGSVIRELTLIRSVIAKAREEWRWIPTNPFVGLERPTAPKHRDRRIAEQEIQVIVELLNYREGLEFGEQLATPSQLTAIAFLLALETAMRAGDVLSIWGVAPSNSHAWVDYAARAVYRPVSKNGDARSIPLSMRAISLLKMIHPTYFQALSAGSRDQLFRRAVKRAGIVNLTFHDSRHEATWRLAKKLNVLELAKVLGVRDPKTLMIYYNPSVTELADKLL
jgi:integrase